ncbi:hypothetical protein GCM10007061_11000 [Kocuria marina]|nr:hypothetical protein GCM10007061_11000 [Kocuria marina]
MRDGAVVVVPRDVPEGVDSQFNGHATHNIVDTSAIPVAAPCGWPVASPPRGLLLGSIAMPTFPIVTAARPHAVPRGSVSPGLLVRSVGTNGQVSSWGANQAGAPPSASVH